MSIYRNPYEVGLGAKEETRQSRCQCCSLPFSYSVPVVSPNRRWCPECSHHYETPDEPLSRLIERFKVHEPRIAEYAHQANQLAAAKHSLAKDYQEKTRAALRSRDGYLAQVRELQAIHREADDKKCRCGLPWPCRSWEVLNPDREMDYKPITPEYRQYLSERYYRRY